MAAERLCFASSLSPSSNGVENKPGAIALTLIPNCANSLAAGKVRLTIPPLEAEYDACPICPSYAATEAVEMITPLSSSSGGGSVIISAAHKRIMLKLPTRLTLMIFSKSLKGIGPCLPTILDGPPMPAQFISILAAPCLSLATAMAVDADCSSATSHEHAIS